MITKVDFDKDFLNNDDNFDGYVIRSYRNNKTLWIDVKDAYLRQTKENKQIYEEYLSEYNRLQELKNNGISIYSKGDPLGELMKNMAEKVNEQKILYSNFLHHINHINTNLGKFDSKSISTIRSRRSRKVKN